MPHIHGHNIEESEVEEVLGTPVKIDLDVKDHGSRLERHRLTDISGLFMFLILRPIAFL